MNSTIIRPIKAPWQSEHRTAFNSVEALFRFLELPLASHSIEPNFPVKVPLSYATLMTKGDVNDPLLRQVLPHTDEFLEQEGYSSDPLVESEVNPIPGLIQKFSNRVLLTLTGNCAGHCRYCFRQNFPYGDNSLTQLKLERIIDYLNQNPQITEVILSGGDPLSLSDHSLSRTLEKLDQLPSIKIIRLHTRYPVFIPSRLTAELLTALEALSKQVVMVLHLNHPNEIGTLLQKKLKPFAQSSITLLNQSVLLAKINDEPRILVDLSYKLFDNGILPYYLHRFDKISGGQRFDLDTPVAQALHQQLKEHLPGYLVPKLVVEEAKASSKRWL